MAFDAAQAASMGWSVPQKLIPRLLAWHKAGKLPFDRMIRVFQFDEINETFEANRNGSVIKSVVAIDKGYFRSYS
jgi:aryl-alcohol dehydrogenase